MVLAKDENLVRAIPERVRSGVVAYRENFRHPVLGVWNDGVGRIHRDNNITLSGMPTMRLDTGGQTNGGPANPGRTANTGGVIVKRRLLSNYNEIWGMAIWFRLTSLNLTSNAMISMSIYNRDGAHAHHARVWLNPNGNNQPMLGQILDGAATAAANGGTPTLPSGPAVYTTVVTSDNQNGGGSHTYDLPTSRGDRAGGWHFAKLVTDFSALKYVSLQLDSKEVDLSTYSMDVTDSTGFAGMHHSIEFSASTSTRRYINVANWVGTLEAAA